MATSRNQTSKATAAPTGAPLNAATLDVLNAEKQRLEATFAWFNEAVRQDPGQTPHQRFVRALDVGFSGARLALDHAQERAHELGEHQHRFEQLTLGALGIPAERLHGWHQQWLDGQQQALAQSSGWAQRWWEQTRDQILANVPAAQRASHV